MHIHSCYKHVLLLLTGICVCLLSGNQARAQLNARFVYSTPGDSCESRSVNFDASASTGNIQLYEWEFTNASTGAGMGSGSGKQVFKNFLSPGTYAIRLTVTDVNGSSDTETGQVRVYEKPVADFTVNIQNGCAPLEVVFTDASTNTDGSIIRWKWNYDDGQSDIFNGKTTPSHTYTEAGNYDPSLIVTNSYGCTESIVMEDLVEVYERITPSFSISENINCTAPHTITIQNTSGNNAGNFSFEWDLGDGTTFINNEESFQHTYTEKGDYTIALTATNEAGTCSYTNQQTEQAKIIVGSPEADFILPTTICEGDSVALSATIDNLRSKGLWMFEDDTTQQEGFYANHKFNTTGLWKVSFIAEDSVSGCTSDTITNIIDVIPFPEAAFEVDSPLVCAPPHTVTFTNNSTNAVRYEWDFGDGSPTVETTTSDSVQYTYTRYGRFIVTLKAFNSEDCVSEKEYRYIRVEEPVIDFSVFPSVVCVNTPFTVISNALDNYNISKYTYTFSDGVQVDTTSDEWKHTFSTLGKQNVQVSAVSEQGCRISSELLEIDVQEICFTTGGDEYQENENMSVSRAVGCADKYTYSFRTLSTTDVISVWVINGDTIETTDKNIEYTFPASPEQKQYIAGLTILSTDTRDTLGGQRIGITIVDETAAFQVSEEEVCRGNAVEFTPIGLNPTVIDHFIWDFGDSSKVRKIDNGNGTKNGKTKYTYKQNGTYIPELIIEDVFGCRDSVVYNSVQIEGPFARFSADTNQFCSGDFNAGFLDNSYASAGRTLVDKFWNFDDGTGRFVTENTSVNHQFQHDDFYKEFNIKLTVEDEMGCKDVISDTIYSFAPKAGLPEEGVFKCGNLKVSINNETEARVTNNAQYTWYYGDGSFRVGKKGNYTYSDTGRYDVSLTVTDDGGCRDSVYRYNYVQLVEPEADFTIGGDTIHCVGTYALAFESTSLYANRYRWNFGDGTITETDDASVSHFYELGGTYPVTLTTYGEGNACVDSITKNVSIRGPRGTLEIPDNYLCVSDTLKAYFNGANVDKYYWDFDDLSNTEDIVNEDTVSHYYNKAGRYVPSIILVSPDNCQATLQYKDTIYVDRIEAGPPAVIKCGGKNVSLNGSAGLNLTGNYYWEGPEGASFTPGNDSLGAIVDSAGVYVLHVKEDLCSATDSVKVTSLGPIPHVDAGPDKRLDCINDQAQLAGNSTSSPVTYLWTGPENGFSGSETIKNPLVDSVGEYILKVTRGQCFDWDTVTVLPCSLNPQDTSIAVCAKPVRNTGFDLTQMNSVVAGDETSAVDWFKDLNFTIPVNKADSVTVKNNDLFYARITSQDSTEIARGSLSFDVYKGSVAGLNYSADTICETNGPVNLQATEVRRNFNYTWYLNGNETIPDVDQSMVLTSPAESGTYVLKVESAFCDAAFDTVNIRIYEQPEVYFTDNELDYIYGENRNVELPLVVNLVYDDSVTVFNWNNTRFLSGLNLPDSLSPAENSGYQPVKPVYYNIQDEEISNTYRVEVITGKGVAACNASAEVIVNNYVPVKVPNVFTPNDDGVNDTWEIFGLGRYPDTNVKVFSRWGQLLYENNTGYHEPWDGYHNGEKVPFGTYYYVIEFKGSEEYAGYETSGWLLISE